jgi:hypothetical protein
MVDKRMPVDAYYYQFFERTGFLFDSPRIIPGNRGNVRLIE